MCPAWDSKASLREAVLGHPGELERLRRGSERTPGGAHRAPGPLDFDVPMEKTQKQVSWPLRDLCPGKEA